MEKEDSLDRARNALMRAQASEKALTIARSALISSDLAELAKAKAMGWTPSIGDSSEWFGLAMSKPNPEIILWMLESFPLDAYSAEFFKSPSAMSSRRWSLSSMKAVEPFALRRGQLGKWLEACLHAPAGVEYVAGTLEQGAALSVLAGAGAAGARWEPVEAAFALLSKTNDQGLQKKLADFCAKGAVANLAQVGEMDGSRPWPTRVETLALSFMDEAKNIAPLAAILETLPHAMTRLQDFSLKLSGSGPERLDWAELTRSLMPANSGHRKRYESKPLGLWALCGKSVENLSFAIEAGWVGKFDCLTKQKCENPLFIAKDVSDIHARKGFAVDMEPRWAKCRQTIESSDLQQGRKNELMDQWTIRNASAWSEGMPKVFEVNRKRPCDPMAMMLALSGVHSGRGSAEDFEKKVRVMLEAGFSLADSVSSDCPIADESKKRMLPGVKILLEREELGRIAGQGAPESKRRMAL